MKKNINTKQLTKGILTICSYLLLSIILQIPFLFLPFNYLYLFSSLSITLVFIYFYRKDLYNDSKNLKKNILSILKTTLIYWLIGLTIMIVSSYIIEYLNIPVNTTNEEQNIELLKNYPIVSFIVMIILAPITEELVFRKSFKNFTTNKHIFAFTTGIIFASLHLFSSFQSLSDIIMIIHIVPYSAVGIAFGYAYQKTDNIYSTMIFHAIHNAITILTILL